MLMNVGVKEVLNRGNYTCFIFHDVDLLPENDHVLYTCSDEPIHMSATRSYGGYKLPYPQYFGGVSAMSKEQFLVVNGFSNMFWGWGGEDDDMYNRIERRNMKIKRYNLGIARYRVCVHLF